MKALPPIRFVTRYIVLSDILSEYSAGTFDCLSLAQIYREKLPYDTLLHIIILQLQSKLTISLYVHTTNLKRGL
jgi:hypothetical protein